MSDPEILRAIKSFTDENPSARRILVRESGTEPLVRIMAEARTDSECDFIVEKIILLLNSRGHLYD